MTSGHARHDAFLTHLSGSENTLRAFIAGALAAADDRADFFQEVVLILWRNFDRYDAARPFTPWAIGVAVRRMNEEYRRVQRRPGLVSAEQLERLANTLTASDSTAADEEAALAECLAALRWRHFTLVPGVSPLTFEGRTALRFRFDGIGPAQRDRFENDERDGGPGGLRQDGKITSSQAYNGFR